MKKVINEPKPKESCLFSSSINQGNPSEQSAIATSFLIGYYICIY